MRKREDKKDPESNNHEEKEEEEGEPVVYVCYERGAILKFNGYSILTKE